MKFDLPVIILKGHILLPHNEIRVDLNIDKSLLEMAEELYDNKVLVVPDIDPLEETLDVNMLSKVGIIALIENKLELPNNITRFTLNGL